MIKRQKDGELKVLEDIISTETEKEKLKHAKYQLEMLTKQGPQALVIGGAGAGT